MGQENVMGMMDCLGYSFVDEGQEEILTTDFLVYTQFGLCQIVAVKQLDINGYQGNREFLAEILTLSIVHHPNLVNLLGYCVDGQQRILVYEYMPNGSLENHLIEFSIAALQLYNGYKASELKYSDG
ncbi:hypothetical protein AgCh_018746 [Apium graveolens]